MLVLTRRSGEDIIIDTETGEEIIVTVFESRAQQTRIGIEASEHFQVLGREVLEREGGINVD